MIYQAKDVRTASTGDQELNSTVPLPAQHLFRMELNWVSEDQHDFEGPFGRRVFRRAAEGSFEGEKVRGHVQNLVSTDYGRSSPDGKLGQVDGYVTLKTDDGAYILMQVRGRTSPRYGEGSSRLQLLISAGVGKYEWLGERQAFGVGRIENGREIVDVYALDYVNAADVAGKEGWKIFNGELVLHRQSEHSPSDVPPMINGKLGTRFISIAEGGDFEIRTGNGIYPPGYSWAAHRADFADNKVFMQIDVNTVCLVDDGTPVFVSYTGVVNIGKSPDNSWRIAAMFEVPEGKHAWLNEVFAIGQGYSRNGGAEYFMYAID